MTLLPNIVMESFFLCLNSQSCRKSSPLTLHKHGCGGMCNLTGCTIGPNDNLLLQYSRMVRNRSNYLRLAATFTGYGQCPALKLQASIWVFSTRICQIFSQHFDLHFTHSQSVYSLFWFHSPGADLVWFNVGQMWMMLDGGWSTVLMLSCSHPVLLLFSLVFFLIFSFLFCFFLFIPLFPLFPFFQLIQGFLRGLWRTRLRCGPYSLEHEKWRNINRIRTSTKQEQTNYTNLFKQFT